MVDSVALREKARQFNVRLEVTKNLQANLLNQVDGAKQDVTDRQGVQNVLRMMSEKLSHESETVTEKIVSLGLRNVFFDEELSFEVSHYITYGKPAIKLILCDHKRRVKGDPMKAYGGGPASLIGILLRVLSIIRQPHLARILILDEPLIQVSGKYKEHAAEIMRKICEPIESGGLGFSALVISHDEAYKKNAQHLYLAQLGEDGESLSLTKKTQIIEDQIDEFTE